MVQTAAEFLKQRGQTTKTAEPKKSFMQSAGDFLLSSEKNFGQDIAQAGYLATGGQKKIDTLSKQYMDNGYKLVELAKKQTDQNRKSQLLKQAESMFGEAKNVGGSIIGETRTPAQIVADAAGVALDIATAGSYSKAGLVGEKAFTTGLQKGVPTIVKGIVKEVATEGAEQVAKRSTKEIAKTILKDSLLGSTYGLVSTAQEKDATAKDYAVNAGLGAIAGAVIPPVVGAGLKGVFKGTKFLAGKAGQLAEKTATGLEKFATKEVENTGSRFYENVYNKAPSIFKKTAEVSAGVIRAGQKLPDQLSTQFLDKYHTLGKFMQRAEKLGVETPDLKDMAQATKYRATGKAENKLDEYLNLRQMYKDDWGTIKEYSHYLDDLDRLANGNTITGNRTVEDVTKDLAKLSETIPPEKMAKIKDGQKELQSFLNNELLDAVDSGRLSPEQYKAIKAKHPNYIPHDVLDYLDEEGTQAGKGIGNSFNVSKSGIEGAKGSTRKIDDIDNAITRRLYRQNILNEKNKTTKAVVDVGKQMGEVGGFKPLRTAENVNQRIEYYNELSYSREYLNEANKLIRDGKITNKEFIRKINKLNDSFKKQEDNFFNELLLSKGENDDLDQLYQKAISEREKIISSKEFTYDSEMENGYQRFKELANRRKWMTDSSIDDVTMKNKLSDVLPKGEIDNMLYSQEMNGDEVLQEFQKRFNYEKSLPKEQKGFIRRYESQSKKVNEAENKLINTTDKIHAENNKIKEIEDNLKNLEDFISDTNKRRKEVFNNLKAIRDIKANKIDYKKEGFEKISYFNNGVREDWLVPDDVGRALKNLDGEESGKVMSWLNNSLPGKIITSPASILRKVATGINPVFALFRNPVRDAQTAILTATDDYSKGLIRTITGKNDEEMYKLARASGALQGSIYREQLKPEQILAQKVQERAGIVKKLLRPDRLVEEWGQKFEEFTRMSVFSGALKNGKTPEEAAKIARNATVDFGKSGNTTQVLNKVIPFLNARIQGFANMGKTVVADPTKATRVLMWSAAYPQAVLTAYNSRYKSYNGIPDYEKRKYWIVMIGENKGKDLDGKSVMVPNYIKIPKGEAQQAVSNTIERVLTLSKQKYPDSTEQFLRKLVGDISPISDSGSGAGGVLTSLIPAGVKKGVELATNYSFYKGKPIEGDWTKVGNKWIETKNLEPKFRTNLNTSQLAKQIGSILNWSPTKIDYVIKTGVIGDIINAYDLLPWPKDKTQIKEDKRKTPFQKVSELPIISGVVGSSYWGEQQAKKDYEAQQLKDKNTKKIQRYPK